MCSTIALVIELQLKLIGDKPRNEAFYQALKKVIVPGKSTISDIGSGTGFLSFLASELGAQKCYLYEYDEPLLELSKELAARNGIKNCTYTPAYSTDVAKPTKTDIVVSETLGNFALEEHIIEIMRDAQRFLKPGGKVLPQALTQYVCPIIAPRLYQEINPWDLVGYKLDMGAAKRACFNNIFVYKIGRHEIMSPENIRAWDRVDFTKKESSKRKGTSTWEIHNKATIFGFAVWWNALITDGIELSTSPLADPTHWDQIFLPLLSPLQVDKGNTLELTIESDTRYEVGLNVAWETKLLDDKKKVVSESRMDMSKGIQ